MSLNFDFSRTAIDAQLDAWKDELTSRDDSARLDY